MKIKILIPYQEYLKLTNTKPAVGDKVLYEDDECVIKSIDDEGEIWLLCEDCNFPIHPLHVHLYKQVEAEVTPKGSTTPGLTWTYN